MMCLQGNVLLGEIQYWGEYILFTVILSSNCDQVIE
jgi:hypothetical protein